MNNKYAISKSEILVLTRYLATYWVRVGIRVNSIAPAGVARKIYSMFVKILFSIIPVAAMPNPEELKGSVNFLCAEIFLDITESNLVVDDEGTIW